MPEKRKKQCGKNTEFLPTDISDTNKRKKRKEKRTRERERERASVVIWKIKQSCFRQPHIGNLAEFN